MKKSDRTRKGRSFRKKSRRATKSVSVHHEHEYITSPIRRLQIWSALEMPLGTNTDRIDDATLALLTLSIVTIEAGKLPGIQVEPEFDLPTLTRLHKKGWLATKPHAPLHAIWLTSEGVRRARKLFRKLFCD